MPEKWGGDGELLIACLQGAGKHHACGARRLPSGHAVIQVDQHGQNAIIIHGGATGIFVPARPQVCWLTSIRGDYLLLQNEISGLSSIIDRPITKDSSFS